MAVAVAVLAHNLAMGDTDFYPPCLLCRPFCVGEDNDHLKVAVYPQSATLRFCSKRCHALDIGDDCIPPVKNGSVDVHKLPSDVHGIWSLRPFCDGGEKLMNLVLVNIFEVSVVHRPQDGVGDVFANDLGDSL